MKRLFFTFALLLILFPLSITIAYTGIPSGYTFTKNLSVGMADPSVIYLKVVLIGEGCGQGITSTDYYGLNTKINSNASKTNIMTKSLPWLVTLSKPLVFSVLEQGLLLTN